MGLRTAPARHAGPATIPHFIAAWASLPVNCCIAQVFEKYLRVGDIHGLEELVSRGLNELGHLCIQHLRTCFASGTFGPRQAGTLVSVLRRYVLMAKSCGADLEDHQSVFRTLWRVQRSRSLAIPAEIVLSVAAWLQNVPELPLLTLLSFHCLFRPTEARQLQWCNVKMFDLSTRYEICFEHRPHQRTLHGQDDRSCYAAARNS